MLISCIVLIRRLYEAQRRSFWQNLSGQLRPRLGEAPPTAGATQRRAVAESSTVLTSHLNRPMEHERGFNGELLKHTNI